MNELDLLPNFICVECWDKIQLFHVFYVSAKITQENYLKNLVKEEVTDNDDGEYNEDSSSIDDAKFETKICVEILNSMTSFLFIFCLNVFIAVYIKNS